MKSTVVMLMKYEKNCSRLDSGIVKYSVYFFTIKIEIVNSTGYRGRVE